MILEKDKIRKIAIGCDHIVTPIKDQIRNHLIAQGHSVIDVGTYDSTRTHFPIYGKRVAEEVVNNHCDFGIVICGTGVGITNSANKVKGARTVLAKDLFSVKYAREKFNANILGFGGRIVGQGFMEEAIDLFRDTEFIGDGKLVELIDSIVEKNDPKNDFYEQNKKWDDGKYHD